MKEKYVVLLKNRSVNHVFKDVNGQSFYADLLASSFRFKTGYRDSYTEFIVVLRMYWRKSGIQEVDYP